MDARTPPWRRSRRALMLAAAAALALALLMPAGPRVASPPGDPAARAAA